MKEQPQIGDTVIVRDFKSQGVSVGDVKMEVLMHSVGTYPGSAKRVQLRSDELQFTGWMPLNERIKSTDVE